MEERLLTVGELADALRVPPSWVYARTRERGPGAMPMLKIGKYNRFRLSAVMSWIEEKDTARG